MFRTKGLLAAVALVAAGTAGVIAWQRLTNRVPVLMPGSASHAEPEPGSQPRVIQAAPEPPLRELPRIRPSSAPSAPYAPQIHVPRFPAEEASVPRAEPQDYEDLSSTSLGDPLPEDDGDFALRPVLPAVAEPGRHDPGRTDILVRAQNPEAPSSRPAASRSDLESEIARFSQMASDGQISEAHLGLSRLYWQVESDRAGRARVREALEPLAERLFFSGGQQLDPPYVVQPGDRLERIGSAYAVPWQYLARINGIADPRRLRAGQTLRVVRGPFEAVVDLSDFELIVVLGDRWVRRYPVGVGRGEQRTPLGIFTVVEKVEDPPYDGPLGSFANNDPDNPIGEHWIDLGDGYGIHGTIEPESVGRASSRGCIRMRPEDVEEVFHLLVPGSRVLIRE